MSLQTDMCSGWVRLETVLGEVPKPSEMGHVA